VKTIVSSGWARPRGKRLHRALDLPVPVGTPIHAIDEGRVVRVEPTDRGDAGIWVGVEHPSGLVSRYLHFSRADVVLGQWVERGAVLGLSGNTGHSTGPHLHLDLRVSRAMLATIERWIGKPRAGWGPELEPYGFSIPGEPWVPIDGYRDRVRKEAVEQGIPLYLDGLRNAGFTYRSVGDRGEPYPEWVRALRGKAGVYVIRDRETGETLYVGQSTGRLYATLTRHFQSWRRYKGFWRGQYAEGHDPGLTYPRGACEVAVRITGSGAAAIDEEARLIRRLKPRDNLQGQPEQADVPF
jgi:hypothetical protein